MPNDIPDSALSEIVQNLLSSDTEREFFEFKENNTSPETLGKNVSAITNSLIIKDSPRGYIIWGVRDGTHEIMGTTFRPYSQKVGSEDMLLWLSKHIQPKPTFCFREIKINDKKVVVLVIYATGGSPSEFDGNAYIRIGPNTRPLREYPNLERELWSKIIAMDYESVAARSCLSKEEALSLLDFDTFYQMRQNRVAVERKLLFDEAIHCGIVQDNKDSTYNITNLGALLYAKNLQDFPQLAHKTIRVIRYADSSKLTTISENRGKGGYIVEFNQLLSYIMQQTVVQEVVENGIQRPEYLYPKLTVRELFANAIAHQDLAMNTMHPMIEIYSDRIEFTNSGAPLVPVDRFVDYPPQTRNKGIVEELFKVGICESRGSGWDKIATEASDYKFPAPRPDVTKDTTRIILTGRQTLAMMTSENRLWTLYIYACLLWTKKEFLTNTLVRQLFNIPDENMSTASNLLSLAVRANKIKVFDEQAGTRSRKYIPIYASADNNAGSIEIASRLLQNQSKSDL